MKMKGGLLLVLIALYCGSVNAASFRCYKGFVSTGDHKVTVLLRCGEPFFAEIISADDELKIEEWTYPPRHYRGFLRVLRFKGGRLVDISVGDKVD